MLKPLYVLRVQLCNSCWGFRPEAQDARRTVLNKVGAQNWYIPRRRAPREVHPLLFVV